MKKISAILVGCALAAGSAHGALFSSWEDGTLGGWTVPAGVTSDAAATVGVTEGTHSLRLDLPAAANSWTLYQIQHSTFGAAGNGLNIEQDRVKIEFDVTTNAANVWATQLVQGGNPAYSSGVVGPTDCSSSDGSWKTTRVAYDFSAVYPVGGVVGWENYRMVFRGDNSGNPSVARTIYVDNYSISAVPEPAMLSLLAVAGLALARRRSA